MDEPLNMDHHQQQLYTDSNTELYSTNLDLRPSLRSNPLDIIKALKPVGSLSFGMQGTIYFKQWNRITCLL